MVVCVAINLERTSNLSSKVVSCGYDLLIILFSRRIHHSKTDFNNINFLAWYRKCACVGPIFSRCILKMSSYKEVPGYIRFGASL